MADEARCTPLHPENTDATCSDVRELLAPTSFHMVHGGCASVLNVDKALIGQLSPLSVWASCRRRLRVPAHAPHTECRRAGGGMAGLRMSVKCLHKMDGALSALACRRSPLSAS